MSARLEKQKEPKPKTAADLTLEELNEIAAGIRGIVTPVDTDEMTGYILSQPKVLVDIFFKRKPHELPQTLVRIEGMPTIKLGNPEVSIFSRSITFVNEGEKFRDIFVLTQDLYGYTRVINENKRS